MFSLTATPFQPDGFFFGDNFYVECFLDYFEDVLDGLIVKCCSEFTLHQLGLFNFDGYAIVLAQDFSHYKEFCLLELKYFAVRQRIVFVGLWG